MQRRVTWSMFLLMVCSAVPVLAQDGTDPNGYPTRYLVLGPYRSPGCCPGVAPIMEDFLCDGTISEDNIAPFEGM